MSAAETQRPPIRPDKKPSTIRPIVLPLPDGSAVGAASLPPADENPWSNVEIPHEYIDIMRMFIWAANAPEGADHHLVALAEMVMSAIADQQRVVEVLDTEELDDYAQAKNAESYTKNAWFYGLLYEFEPGMVSRTYRNYLKKFIDAVGLPNGKPILVLGSGAGRDTLILSGKGYRVEGMDSSESMADWNSSFFPGESIRIWESNIVDAKQTFKSARDHYKGILAESVLEHLNKQEIIDLIPYLAHILASDGILLMRLKLTDHGKAYMVRDGVGERYFTSWTLEEIEKFKELLGEYFEVQDDPAPIAEHIDAIRDGNKPGATLKPPFYTIMAKRKPKV